MQSRKTKNIYRPALTCAALASFVLAAIFLAMPARAQKVKQLPPPPPGPVYKPKPTPTPGPEDYDVVRV
ncbi:MAG TPA: hypothetical protein VIU65_00550, partial [Pyrinomonadaceae bacterium]